jgi:hypothetical protein
VKCIINKPNQPVNGPGKTGKKEPIRPSITNKKPIVSKNISIVNFIVEQKYKTFVTI